MKIRKAILTGGGRATRLQPITATINKHLLPLANKPMIFHAIEKVVEAGITDIFINTNPGETELQKHVGDGGHWGVRITFFEQSGGPLGIAHVVNEAKRFIGHDPFLFYLSDNILLGQLTELLDEFSLGRHDCMLALCEVPDPERFGVPYFDAAGRLVDVVEKPLNPPNRFAVTGLYLYGPKVFFDAFEHIEKSPRGEYEISSIHSYFLKHGFRVGHKEITGWWKDTGKPDDLLAANELLLHTVADHLWTHPNRVRIGEGTRIGEDVSLVGPVVIGASCVLEHCTLGPNVAVGDGVVVRGAEITRTILLNHATVSGAISLTDSLVGRQATIVQKNPSSARVPLRMVVGDKTLLEL